MVKAPYFARNTMFPREPQENCKIYNFNKGGTLFVVAKEKIINIISVTNIGLLYPFSFQKQHALSSQKKTCPANIAALYSPTRSTAGRPSPRFHGVKLGHACSLSSTKTQSWYLAQSDDESSYAQMFTMKFTFFKTVN